MKDKACDDKMARLAAPLPKNLEGLTGECRRPARIVENKKAKPSIQPKSEVESQKERHGRQHVLVTM